MSTSKLSSDALADLGSSGLEPSDINVRALSIPELSACGITGEPDGYGIPYYNMVGRPIGFYRLKIFGKSNRYAQPKQTSTHIYFPQKFLEVQKSQALLQKQKTLGQQRYIIITEGEKKAACATKYGFPTIGLGGVYSWRNRTLILPSTTDLAKVSYNRNAISAKLPEGSTDLEETSDTILAQGFMEFIDYVVSNKIHVIIIFDTDEWGVKDEVQRAAAALGFELRYRGLAFDHIHQLILPSLPQLKVGLDDFLIDPSQGPDALDNLITQTFHKSYSFPRHPNIREHVNRKLQKTKMSRKEAQQISLAILADLDANGTRLRSKEEQQMYYFDNRTHQLTKVFFSTNNTAAFHGTTFGQLLYQNYGMSSIDQRILQWLDIQFNSEKPIEEVTPNRVIGIQRVTRSKQITTTTSGPDYLKRGASDQNAVRYQIGDGEYVKVSDNPQTPIQILDNGSEGFMFLSDQVEEIDADLLLDTIGQHKQQPLEPWWDKVLDNVRLKDTGSPYSKTALMLLYYISPWLNKWRGMQLPVELVIGEPGSGKSSLYEHRLNVLTGDPELRNAPSDLKDWHASITNTGGLHVTDNVQLVNRDLRQRLSDELCRIVTEPNPHIEMRKLYSNNELIRIPIHATFAITAIQQPFQNADLIQRAVKIELDKSGVEGAIEYDSEWVYNQMTQYGGRAHWIAHHLVVLERFFSIVREEWDPRYQALHRLIHFEQSMRMMAKVFGIDDSWIPDYLAGTTERNISQADWVIEGLKAFTEWVKETQKPEEVEKGKFAVSKIVEWAEEHDEYKDNSVLTNARSLGRYIQSNKYIVKTIAHIDEAGNRNNRQVYRIAESELVDH